MTIRMNFFVLEQKVIQTNLCVSCGTCIGVCPVSVLRVNYFGEPELKGTCINCGECFKYCPVLNFNFEEFRKHEVTQKYDPFIGKYSCILFGKTTDEEIWWKTAGGGITSSILISALEKGLISGAIVVRFDKNDLTARPFIARTRKEVLLGTQSKYVPANVNFLLSELKEEDGTFAVVGLPCQVQAIRMLQKNGPSWVAKKIKYVIGLFCGYTLRASVMDYLLSNVGVDASEIRNLWFRYKLDAKTSALVVETTKGNKICIEKGKYNYLFYLFPKIGCLYCMDYTAEFSDISVGDMRPLIASSLEYQKIRPLQSLIIVRTEKGMELLRNIEKMEIHDLSLHELIVSKLTNLVDRKICSHTRTNLRRSRGHQTPNYNCHVFNEYLLPKYHFKILPKRAYSLKRYIYEILWLKILELTNNKLIVKILSRVPMKLLGLITRHTIIKYKAKGFYEPI